MKIKKLSRHYIFIAVIFWIVYCGASLLSPIGEIPEQYGISETGLRLLLVSLYLPFLVCWIFAISAWLNFWNYTRTLPEGTLQSGFFKITMGLFVLAVDLTIPGMIGVFYTLFGGDMSHPTWIILNRYLDILLPLLSFLLMYLGSIQLVNRTDQKIQVFSKIITAILPAFLFSVFYAYMVFTDPIRQISSDSAVPATYFLPDSLIALTVMLPVIATWVIGLLLILNLEHYSHHTRTVNRRGLISFYNGMLIIVASVIIIQAINSVGSARFQDINFGLVVFLLYALLLIIALGLGFIARGAKNLHKRANPEKVEV